MNQQQHKIINAHPTISVTRINLHRCQGPVDRTFDELREPIRIAVEGLAGLTSEGSIIGKLSVTNLRRFNHDGGITPNGWHLRYPQKTTLR